MIGKYAEPDPELWAIIERNGVTTNSRLQRTASANLISRAAPDGCMPSTAITPASGKLPSERRRQPLPALHAGMGQGDIAGRRQRRNGRGLLRNVDWRRRQLEPCLSRRCLHLLRAVDPSHQHVFDEGVVTREPTCTEEGERLLTCTLCGETETEPIEELPHTFENGRCTVCGAPDPDHTHIYTDHEETLREPTCTEPGRKGALLRVRRIRDGGDPGRDRAFKETEFEWSGDYLNGRRA